MNERWIRMVLAVPMLSVGLAHVSMAQELAQVLSSVPVVQQRTTAQQVCHVAQEVAPQQNPGTGALLCTVAGGAVGNAIGSGEGRALATLFGVVLGALWGDRIEGRPAPQFQQVRHCTLQGVQQPQVVGYDVQYAYAGRQYRVRMPYDPGPTLAVQVTPVPTLSGERPQTISLPLAGSEVSVD
jgi:uncharacterized protein YcfJ